MSRKKSSGFLGENVGVWGDGQLARMLVQAAQRLGLRPRVLGSKRESPAGQIAPDFLACHHSESAKISAFFQDVKVVAIESEFVDAASLGASVSDVRPAPSSIDRVRNKFEQKKVLQKLGIATSPFSLFSGEESEFALWLEACVNRWQAVVLKWSHFGYDGHGVLIQPSHKKEMKLFLEQAKLFYQKAKNNGSAIYAEKKVSFKRELAKIACLSVNHEIKFYPLVISEQKEGICKRVYGPARFFGVSELLEKKANLWAHKIGKEFSLVGAYGIEFFQTEKGELLVNEIAPRVHNSGHYTQNAMGITCQFENHWRALLGWPLGSTEPYGFFGMENLLGFKNALLFKNDGVKGSMGVPSVAKNSYLHWYGKTEMRPQRKMGHINVVSPTKNDLMVALSHLKRSIRGWETTN